jgi:serine/threonine-protein kinase RsbT
MQQRIPIASDSDIVDARLAARGLAESVGFRGSDLVVIATAISEVARNVLKYAKKGEILLFSLEDGTRKGLGVIARDQGPGIPDVTLAMRDGYSTTRGLGLGLPGVKRLMDEFDIVSTIGRGTTVTMKKWKNS